MWCIFNYRSIRVIYFWPIRVNFHWAISAPIISRHSNFAAPVRKSSRSNNEESPCPPGPLPRTTPESHDVLPACWRGKHLCLLSVCPKFRSTIVWGSASFSTDFIFLHFPAEQFLMFPFVLGKLIYGPTFDCPCEWYLTKISCMLYAEDFRLSYCVNWLFTSSELLRGSTVHKLNCVHESSLFSSCSTEHLWIVSPQPQTPTWRQQLVDVYDLPQSPTSSRIDEWSSRLVRIAPVNFLRRLFVSALILDSLTDRSIILSSNW